MANTFNIYGDIVDVETQKTTPEDVCPQDFKSFIDQIDNEEPIEICINSAGGSVSGGISIANAMRSVSRSNKVIAKINGMACSIASVIACAADEIVMSPSSFIMIHQVWSTVSGNSDELRRQADIMEQMNQAIISFYRSKFSLSDEQLVDMMRAETWISGDDAKNFNLNVIIDNSIDSYQYAAKLIDKVKQFNNRIIIERLNMEKETIKEETTELSAAPVAEDVEEVKTEETKEDSCKPKAEETIVEEVKEEVVEKQPTVDELQAIIEELKKKIAELEEEKQTSVEDRVAKCQSVFQNKINNFKNELMAKDEELQKFKDSVSSLTTELDTAKKELHDMSAAFQEKNEALAKLNASVLTPSDELPTFKDGYSNCKTLNERIQFINSGKYKN